jgi:hypothetical protein
MKYAGPAMKRDNPDFKSIPKELISWESIADYTARKDAELEAAEQAKEAEAIAAGKKYVRKEEGFDNSFDIFINFLPCEVCEENPAQYFLRVMPPKTAEDKSPLIYSLCSEECKTMLWLQRGVV